MRLRRSSSGILALVAIAGAPASAQTGDELRWRCGYEAAPGPRIACRLVQWPGPEAPPVSPSVSIDRLPPLVRRIRMAPETFEGERIVIPLYGPPVDMRFVARLAREVMCGSRPGCGVDFSAEPHEN